MRTTPMVARPMTMITTPKPRTIVSWFRRNVDPRNVTAIPKPVNTAVNPATKSSAARTVTRRAARSSSPLTGSADT